MNEFDNVLITGIAGSGGSYLAEQIILNYPNSIVTGLARGRTSQTLNHLANINGNVKVLLCDLGDSYNLKRILKKIKPSLIFNIASQANVLDSYSNVQSTTLNNVGLMVNLLESVRDEIPKVRLIHCSTSEVYGIVNKSELPIKESQPFRPTSPYSVSKIFQDLVCDVYVQAFNLNIVKTRMFSYINPRREDLFASSFAKQIAEIEVGKREKLEHGNLESIRTLLDIRDAMNAYIAAAKFCVAGETYNIGGDYHMSVGEFLSLMLKKSKVKIECITNQDLFRPVDVTLQIPDDSKFRLLTGWKPLYSIEETIQRLLDYWRVRVLHTLK